MQSNKEIMLLLTLFFAITHLFTQSQTIVINEIMASNATTIADEDGDFEDWIEIYNYGDDFIPLLGYGLSDNHNNPLKWVFPNVKIEPNGFIIIFASGKDRKFHSKDYDTNWFMQHQPASGYWSFDEIEGDSVFDSTGNFNHGLIQGAQRNLWDHFGGAIAFNKQNGDRIVIPNQPSLQLNGSMTVSMWLYLNDYSGGSNPWDKSYKNEGSITVTNDGALTFYWGVETDFQGFNSNTVLPLNQWTYIALVRDLEQGFLKWFYNGELVAIEPASYLQSGISSNNLQIGRGYAGTFDGAIAKPILLPYAASSEQILDLYLAFRGNLHANFSISAQGEEVVLSRPDGSIIDEYPPLPLPVDVSYGRQADGTDNWFYFDESTPWYSNTTNGYNEIMQPPALSHSAGFYEDGFLLSISHPDPEASILYTIDGSIPCPDNIGGNTFQYKNQFPENPGDEFGSFLSMPEVSFEYTEPLQISDPSEMPNTISMVAATYSQQWAHFPDVPIKKANVIRARAFKEGALPGSIKSASYFIDNQGRNRYELPVISMITDASNLFDYYAGIWTPGVDFDSWRLDFPNDPVDPGKPANYHRKGRDWEYPAHFEYFETGEQQAVLSHGAGFRMHGEWGRSLPRKNTKLYARSSYGAATFNHCLFPGQSHADYKVFLLRNSDWGSTNLRDQYMQYLAGDIGFETQDYRPVILFINGEYWGLGIQQERYDEHFMSQKYGIEENEFDQIKARNEVEHGDIFHYNYMLSYIENNSLAAEENYDYFETLVDIDNFTDYWITNIFFGNNDWPYKNIRLWRKRTPYSPGAGVHDGRWRWLMFDLDWCFDILQAGNVLFHTTMSEENGSNRPNWSTSIIRALLVNEKYKQFFITRFSDLLNTDFHPEVTSKALEMFREKLAPFMPEHIERWKSMSSYQRWHTNVDGIKTYALQWPDTMYRQLRNRFELNESLLVNLKNNDPTGGFIRLNTINIPDSSLQHDGTWQGKYFRGIPMKFEAVAKPGYVFSHWLGLPDANSPQQTISPEEDLHIKAFFEFVGAPELLFFWYFDTQLPNDQPLENITPIFCHAPNAMLHYESCLEGYPFFPGHPNWRKASMERRNAPTPINYLPEANDSIPYNETAMRGIQVKQPFVADENENNIIFHLPSTGYRDLTFRFAAKDEGAASHLVADYCLSESASEWSTEGLNSSNLILGNDYTLYELDFSDVDQSNNNAFLKTRIRFAGPNMSADEGDRVTFNNFSLHGNLITAIREMENTNSHTVVSINPNPFTATATVSFTINESGPARLLLFNIFGQVVSTLVDGYLVTGSYSNTFDASMLSAGVYFLQLQHNGQQLIHKIIRTK